MDASCDPGQGCVTIPNTLPCNDLDACTEGDVCAEGVCAGETVVCDDEDVCTSDSCDVTDGCQNVAVDKPCDDGDACTVDEACEALDPVCNGGSAVNIDDGVSCTLDSCDSIEGPEHTPDPTLCDVGEACDPIAGCQPGDMNLVVSKFSIYPTEPMVDGQGQWFAVTNVGETVVDITAVFVFNDQGQGASVKATTGDASDSVLIAPGETLAGLKTPGADPPVDPTLFDFFFDNPAGTFSWNAAGDTIRLGDQSNETVDELVVKGVHQGALEVDEHPSVLGLATELDAAALATATSQSDNDEPLQWCAWANDGTDPSGANPDCGRVRLHEIFVATQAEPRFVELHLPFGGSTGTLQLVVVDGDGVVVSTHVVEGDRMAVGEPLVYVDDLDTAIGLATDGAVMIVRDGALLDVYGFGTQTVAVSVDGHAMVEGTPGPAQTDSESAQRSSPGGDTGDNATDFVQATPTQGAL